MLNSGVSVSSALLEDLQEGDRWERPGVAVSALSSASPGALACPPTPGYLLSPKQLHPQQSEDHNEEEKQEEEADDGLHGIEEGYHQVPQGIPIPVRQEGWLKPCWATPVLIHTHPGSLYSS